MIDRAKLDRDIKTLEEAIALNKLNLRERTQEELAGIIRNTAWLMGELERLIDQTEQLQAAAEHVFRRAKLTP